MKTKMIIIAAASALAIAVGFKLKSNKATVEAGVYHLDPGKKVLVQAAPVSVKGIDRSTPYTGTFMPFCEVMLVPQAQGQVTGVFFEEGEVVSRGKKLVQIDDDLLQAQYASVLVNYQTAKKNLERYEKASENGGVSKVQLDDLKLNLKNAESQKKQLEKQIELSHIDAPFTGTITMRSVEVGTITSKDAIGRLTDLTLLKLEISVPESDINQFKAGQTTTIASDVYAGVTFTGKVEYVSDRADNSHNYMVKILVKNNNRSAMLKGGMYGTAWLGKGNGKGALVIPRSALLGSAKNPQVFVIENNVARLVSIQTGRSNTEYMEVVKGLTAGQVVAVSGHINLSNGSMVEIAK